MGFKYLLLSLAIFALSLVNVFSAQDVREILDRAVEDFEGVRLEEAVVGFDRVAELVPNAAPQLWQRGIALYYVGRYRDCREQFESHRLVNPNDVENAAWHFLCVALQESPTAAIEALLPVGADSRAPMAEIYQLFRGTTSPEAVIETGRQAGARGEFYAHLYVGLFHEAFGRERETRRHIAIAAADQFAAAGGYMHMVARVHLATFEGVQ